MVGDLDRVSRWFVLSDDVCARLELAVVSVDYQALRADLRARIRATHERRHASQRNAPQCDHDFRRFRQTIVSDRGSWNGEAYFIVSACMKCKLKELIDLVVNP